ncbi:hypothetical protein [Raoultella sp. C349492]|uniref:hypothetical protein n=1 Tax=Raoultella sp. C349492 TaxID=2970253 RepID=UPI0035C708B1
MAIETLHRLIITFDIKKEDMHGEIDAIDKIGSFVFDISERLRLDDCFVNYGGAAHLPYCMLEHSERACLEKAECEIQAYIGHFIRHKTEI